MQHSTKSIMGGRKHPNPPPAVGNRPSLFMCKFTKKTHWVKKTYHASKVLPPAAFPEKAMP